MPHRRKFIALIFYCLSRVGHPAVSATDKSYCITLLNYSHRYKFAVPYRADLLAFNSSEIAGSHVRETQTAGKSVYRGSSRGCREQLGDFLCLLGETKEPGRSVLRTAERICIVGRPRGPRYATRVWKNNNCCVPARGRASFFIASDNWRCR